MKRKLSLLLAVVMILGSFSFAFAKEDVKPADFLEDKGVLKGDESGDLMLDKPLERRDAVVMLSRLLGEEEEAEAYEADEDTVYPDNNDPYYEGFLAWATANEYFEGYEDGTFRPRNEITVQEYAVVLLRALGYGETEWNDVMAKAKELGLFADLELEANDAVLRGEMAEMTFAALGTEMKDSDETLADKLGIEMPEAKELKAVVNDTENLKEVVVELSNAKLADEEKLVDKDNYRVDSFKVERVTLDGDNVIVELEKALVKGRSYDLHIRNIDKAINGKYGFKAYDNASPRVVDVEVLGEYGIKLTTSEPVKEPREREFLIDGKNVAMIVEQYGRVIVLTPYHKSAFPANAETLTVKSLEDYAGYTAALEDFEIEIFKDDVAPEVVDVVLKGAVVEVTFDKDIYADSVEGYVNRKDVGNISYKSGRHDIYTLEEKSGINYGKKVETNKAEYTFKEEPPKRTEFTIEGVQNHSKVEMERVTLEAREVKDDLGPEIIDVDISKTAVKGAGASSVKITLEFDKAIKDERTGTPKVFDAKDYFDLYEEEVASRYKITDPSKITANYKGDKDDTVEVVITGLNINEKRKYDYILEVRNFRSESGNKMYRDYVDFEIKEDKVFDVAGIKISGDEDETEIAIKFTQPVDRVRAEDETNYLFRKAKTDKPKDVADLDGDIIVEKDGYTVTLVLPEFQDEGYKFLEILAALRDKDGNKLANSKMIAFDDIATPAFLAGGAAAGIEDVTYIGNNIYEVELVKGYTGSVSIIHTTFAGTIVLKGDIVGDVTVNIPLGTVDNHATAGGGIVVDGVAVATWNEYAEGNEFVINIEKITFNVKAGASVKKVVANEDFILNNAGEVEELEVAAGKEVKVETKLPEKTSGSGTVTPIGDLKEKIEAEAEAEKEVALEAAVAAVNAVKLVTTGSELEDIAEAMELVAAAEAEIGKIDEDLKEDLKEAVNDYTVYETVKAFVGKISHEEGIVDYSPKLNETHEDENIKGHYFIKVTVTGDLDKSTIEAIYSVDSGKDLNPDTDTVLWFRVAKEGEETIALHEDGTYTYLVKTSDETIYSFSHEFEFGKVNFPVVEEE